MATARKLRIRPLWIRQDRTEHGWHLVIEWDARMKPAEIVALQAILGSDPKREAWNLRRVLGMAPGGYGNRRWNLLYSTSIWKA